MCVRPDCRRVGRTWSAGDVVSKRPWSSGVGSKGKNTRGSRSLLLLVHVASLVSQDVDSREEVASQRWVSSRGSPLTGEQQERRRHSPASH